MGIKCKAVVFTEPRQVEVRQIELPEGDRGDIVVRTLYSGISAGTELWSLTGKYWCTRFPTIPGYQKVGVVEQVVVLVRAQPPLTWVVLDGDLRA